ncbi:MAG: NosD domain-containing protein, partial [Archaeoglobaceae archaeon]
MASANIYVPDNYTTIQQAIDNATPWSVIIVKHGGYVENLRINKPLTIKSAYGAFYTILDGNGGIAIRINSNDVTIEGFTVTNSSQAISIAGGAFNVTIRNCTLNLGVHGIYFDGGNSNIRIENNKIENIGGYPIRVWFSSNLKILNNTLQKNKDLGLYAYSMSYSEIKGNIIKENEKEGIYLLYSENNTITGNWIEGNLRGLRLDYSSKNTIYNNYFNNSMNVMLEESSFNGWSITKTYAKNIIGGNYIAGNVWLDPYKTYRESFSLYCSDSNKDGICDSAYTLGVDNVDYFPIKMSIEPETPFTPVPGAIYVPDNYTTIQQAIDNATPWSVIIVKHGGYVENLRINKPLTIKSA